MMKRMRRIESPKVARLLFLLCWFAYFTSYIGRLNYSSAMTAMIQEAVLTKSQAGFISMVYFFAYGIGQFCNGMLGDRFHPGKMIFTGLAIAAGANLCMGFVSGFGAMAVVWGINGYAQAMIWPPVIRIFAEMVSREQKMKFCVNIVSSQVVGTLALLPQFPDRYSWNRYPRQKLPGQYTLLSDRFSNLFRLPTTHYL